MTLRQAVASRVELIAGLVDLATFAMERPAFDDLLNDHAFVLELTFPVRSKAEADKVIEAYAPAARALWRNGVYMAELEPAKLPVSPDRRRILPSEVPSNGGERNRAGVIFEMHFVPLIIEQAA